MISLSFAALIVFAWIGFLLWFTHWKREKPKPTNPAREYYDSIQRELEKHRKNY